MDARGTGVFSFVTGTAEAIRRTQMASPRYMQRTGVDASGDFAVGTGTRALFNVVPTIVFMIKMSRRFSR